MPFGVSVSNKAHVPHFYPLQHKAGASPTLADGTVDVRMFVHDTAHTVCLFSPLSSPQGQTNLPIREKLGSYGWAWDGIVYILAFWANVRPADG